MDIRKNGKSGMTLIEVLVVIALLGVLAAVLVKSVSGSMDAGKMATANLFCDSTFKSAVQAYKVSHGGDLPASMAGLEKFLGDPAPKDPWGNPYGFQQVGPYAVVWCRYNDGTAAIPATIANPGARDESFDDVNEYNKPDDGSEAKGHIAWVK